jgi:hypothetical protein
MPLSLYYSICSICLYPASLPLSLNQTLVPLLYLSSPLRSILPLCFVRQPFSLCWALPLCITRAPPPLQPRLAPSPPPSTPPPSNRLLNISFFDWYLSIEGTKGPDWYQLPSTSRNYRGNQQNKPNNINHKPSQQKQTRTQGCTRKWYSQYYKTSQIGQ